METEHQHDFQFERYASLQERREGKIIEEVSKVVRCYCGKEEIRHVLYKNEFPGVHI